MAEQPDQILPRLVHLAMELCGGQSAGVTSMNHGLQDRVFFAGTILLAATPISWWAHLAT